MSDDGGSIFDDPNADEPDYAQPHDESAAGSATEEEPRRHRAPLGARRTAVAHVDRQWSRSAGDWVLLGLRGIGQTLITGGLVILLFVVYEVWITNIFADAKQSAVHKVFEQEIAQGDDPLVGASPTQSSLPGSSQVTIPIGTGIANIYIPRLGDDYHFTIVEGTGDASLEKGPGHYAGTALPGQVGNFSVAGHRVGKGEPFLNLDKLRPGDAVVIETAKAWYVYRVIGNSAAGEAGLAVAGVNSVVGREIVSPADGKVIAPVPNQPGVRPTNKLITLTTCEPKFTANKRMIIHGLLSRTVPRDGDSLPKELTGGTL